MSVSPPPLIRILPHLAAVAVIVLCGYLAVWQFDRAEEKRTLLTSWDEAPAVSLARAAGERASYLRVSASGRFESSRQVLLDNQIRGGRAGVHVFTLFRPDEVDGAWLVNRGWHTLPSRQSPLPDPPAPEGKVELSGRLVGPPQVGRQLGQARELDPGRWPQLVTYLDLERVEDAIGFDLAGRVILLEPDHPAHLSGDAWQPINITPERHLAYAWQWITMAIAVFLIWVGLTWRSLRLT